MPSTEHLVASAAEAIRDHRHVDIIGPRLSGRSTALGHLVDLFRDEGWEVLEIPGRTPPALLPSLDAERGMIAADDWDLLDAETRALITGCGATVATTRAGGEPAFESMHQLSIAPLDAEALRVLLTRVLGFVLEHEDARSLAVLVDGSAGAAIGVANSARERGELVVSDGRAAMSGSWVDSAGPVVASLLEPLSAERQEALAGIAQSAIVRGVSGAAVDELVGLGYLEAVPDDAVRVSSTLLRRWFTRP